MRQVGRRPAIAYDGRMATVISKEEAYAHLADVVDRALAGEEIAIEQAGRVALKLVPVTDEALPPRRFGTLGPISDEEADEAMRPLPKEYWGYIGDDDD